ncbi:hypothetical protein HDU97_004309 [Phlyctochytrium planicorne]|nr:hypothetical protein HDU97_004309 [Phlyctochytrium planicorne]
MSTPLQLRQALRGILLAMLLVLLTILNTSHAISLTPSFASSVAVANGEILYIAGSDGDNSTSNVWAINVSVPLSSSVPRKVPTLGEPTPTVSYMQCVFDGRYNKLYCLGGYNGNVAFPLRYPTPSMKVLDISTYTWSTVEVSGLPKFHSTSSIAWMPNNKIYIIQGFTEAPNPAFTLPLEYVGVFDPVTLSLEEIKSPTVPIARALGCVVPVSSTGIFLFGGLSGYGSTNMNDTYIYDIKTNVWTNYTTGVAPDARYAHMCTLSPDKSSVLMFGGSIGTDYDVVADFWEFDLSSFQWKISSSNSSTTKPTARFSSNSVAINDYWVMAGGYLGSNRKDANVYFYDMVSRAWGPAPDKAFSLPEEQSYHSPGTYFGSQGTAPSTSGNPSSPGTTPGSNNNNSNNQSTASSSSNSNSSSTKLIIIGAAVAGAVAIIGATAVVILYYQKRRKTEKEKVELSRQASDLSRRPEVNVDGTLYQHNTGDFKYDNGGGLDRNNTASTGLPRYDPEDPTSPRSTGSGGSGSSIPAVMFQQPIRDDELVKRVTGTGTLERVLQPIVVDWFDLNPNTVLAQRYRITGAPLSAPTSRFVVVPAEDLHNREPLAIKAYTAKQNVTTWEAAESAFKREVSLLRKLKHQNIVQIHGFHTIHFVQNNILQDVIHLSIMQRCTENLAQFMQRTPSMQDLLIRTIVKGICEGLAHLADNGIVHADLKPSNILLTDGIFPRIADLESARLAHKETVSTVSLAYASPEVAEACHRPVPTEVLAMHSVDMWALGCIIFEMYSGRGLMAGMSEDQMMSFLMSREPVRVPQGMVTAAQARHLLASLLARDPGSRKTARQVLSSAYLNAGQDTVEIANSRGRIEEKLTRVERQVGRVEVNVNRIAESQAIVKRILANNMESMVPRIVTLVPASRGVRWDEVALWGTDVFRLHLLCEWTGGDPEDDAKFYPADTMGRPVYVGPHLTLDQGYQIADPREFSRAVGPVLRAGMMIASAALGAGSLAMGARPPMLGANAGAGAGAALFSTVGIRPTEYFEKMTTLLEEVKGSKGDDTVMARRLEGQALREMDGFLQRADPGRRLGGLEKCVDKDGSVVWLCEHHAHIVKRRFAQSAPTRYNN